MTLGKVDYAVRPAKNVERKMICESLQRLSRLKPLPKYRYVGFGSIGFYDFILLHERLGISDMISIESRRGSKKRLDFNKPYSCIKLCIGRSHEILPDLDYDKTTIVWLDYDKPLEHSKIEDIEYLTSQLPSGSMLIVTVPVEPLPASRENVLDARMEDLTERVGEDRIPIGIAGRDLAQWGLASVTRSIIVDGIERTLSSRNAPLHITDKLAYQQVFNFHYADSTRMLTVGGLLLKASHVDLVGPEQFRDLPYIRFADEPYMIEVPLLTLREVRYIEQGLPAGRRGKTWLPNRELEKLRNIYRYYPSYSEVEAR